MLRFGAGFMTFSPSQFEHFTAIVVKKLSNHCLHISMSIKSDEEHTMEETLDIKAEKASRIKGDGKKRLSHILGCGLADIELIPLDGDRAVVTPPKVVMSIKTIIHRIGCLTIRDYSRAELNAFAFNIGAAVTTSSYKTKSDVVLRIQEHLLLASSSYLNLRDARRVST